MTPPPRMAPDLLGAADSGRVLELRMSGWSDPQSAKRPPLSVGFLLANDFTLSAFSLFVDALRLAADEGDYSRPIRCRWAVLGPRRAPVRSSAGLLVTPTHDLDALSPTEFDYVVLVGGILHGRGPRLERETARYLHEAAARRIPLIGVCTGSLLLCREGLMEGRRVCVSWYHHQDFLDEFPDHPVTAESVFVVDGDRITCSGGSGVADLAAHLIRRHLGEAVAQKSLHVLLLERARAAEEAQPHPPVTAAVKDPRVRRSLLLMEQNLAHPLPIATIAARLGVSTRQLERLFHDELGQRPAETYRVLRLRYARWLLENTARSITDIALEAGFADCAHFSRQFREMFGRTPSAVRITRPAPAPSAPLRPLRRQFPGDPPA